MAALTEALDVKAVANEVVASLAGHCQIPTFSSRPGGLTLAQAYRVTPLLRAAFEARGEKITDLQRGGGLAAERGSRRAELRGLGAPAARDFR